MRQEQKKYLEGISQQMQKLVVKAWEELALIPDGMDTLREAAATAREDYDVIDSNMAWSPNVLDLTIQMLEDQEAKLEEAKARQETKPEERPKVGLITSLLLHEIGMLMLTEAKRLKEVDVP